MKPIAFLLLIFLNGCTLMHNRFAAGDQKTYLVHTVRFSGESLAIISKWYTGSAGNWVELARVNSSVKPKSLQLGTRILIPRSLVKQSDPLPKTFLILRSKQQTEEMEDWPGTLQLENDVGNDGEKLPEPCLVPRK